MEPARLREKGVQLGQNLLGDLWWKLLLNLGSPCLPVETLDLIGQDHARDAQAFGDGNLEGVALHHARDGTHDGEPDLAVVRTRRQHDRRPSSALLVAGPRV